VQLDTGFLPRGFRKSPNFGKRISEEFHTLHRRLLYQYLYNQTSRLAKRSSLRLAEGATPDFLVDDVGHFSPA
jgi:hypothetical protein